MTANVTGDVTGDTVCPSSATSFKTQDVVTKEERKKDLQ